jgi:hypothetical protein
LEELKSYLRDSLSGNVAEFDQGNTAARWLPPFLAGRVFGLLLHRMW